MRNYLYKYVTDRDGSVNGFNLSCKKILERYGEKASYEKTLVDVDGSGLIVFTTPDGQIQVELDREVGIVEVSSDMNLDSLYPEAEKFVNANN